MGRRRRQLMTYSNVPLTGQSLGVTKNPINSNFALIQSAFSINHYAIGSAGGANSGKHTFVTMPSQSLASPPSRAAGECVLFTAADLNAPNEPSLYVISQNNKVYQLTKSYQSKFSTFATVPNGWTFLPGALIMQYGQITNPGVNGSLTFPFAFPSTNAPFQIQVTLWQYGGGMGTDTGSATVNNNPTNNGGTPTASKFWYNTTAANVNSILVWSAIGF